MTYFKTKSDGLLAIHGDKVYHSEDRFYWTRFDSREFMAHGALTEVPPPRMGAPREYTLEELASLAAKEEKTMSEKDGDLEWHTETIASFPVTECYDEEDQ